MSRFFNLKSVKLSNYRLFNNFEAGEFKQFNMIGGFNGGGKSSLLEALFLSMDRSNPSAIFRPFEWRTPGFTPVQLPQTLRQMYYKGDTSRPATVTTDTSAGVIETSVNFGLSRASTSALPTLTTTFDPNSNGKSDGLSVRGGGDGFVIKGQWNASPDLEIVGSLIPNGLAANIVRQSTNALPQCVLLNNSTKRTTHENITRFSQVISDGRVNSILEFVNMVHPQVKNIQVLQLGGNLDVCVDIGDNLWIPAAFMGEGASTLLTLALCIYTSKKGVVFLDEIDTSVHYSLLPKLWSAVMTMAHAFDVQIFSTTHSSESLSAFSTAAEGKFENRVSYTRVHNSESGNPKAVTYTGKKLKWALDDQWEVR